MRRRRYEAGPGATVAGNTEFSYESVGFFYPGRIACRAKTDGSYGFVITVRRAASGRVAEPCGRTVMYCRLLLVVDIGHNIVERFNVFS